jgi:hypothetical protein
MAKVHRSVGGSESSSQCEVVVVKFDLKLAQSSRPCVICGPSIGILKLREILA